MHASFGFTHVVSVDIPELDLWEQDVALDLAIDGLLESHEIEAVSIRTRSWGDDGTAQATITDTLVNDQALADKIAARFNADDLAVDAMYDAAHDHLHNHF
tara:strand:- start:1949 stop:2251 length:303 start_codon:yes stop_codon:yes gene_type:complete